MPGRRVPTTKGGGFSPIISGRRQHPPSWLGLALGAAEAGECAPLELAISSRNASISSAVASASASTFASASAACTPPPREHKRSRLWWWDSTLPLLRSHHVERGYHRHGPCAAHWIHKRWWHSSSCGFLSAERAMALLSSSCWGTCGNPAMTRFRQRRCAANGAGLGFTCGAGSVAPAGEPPGGAAWRSEAGGPGPDARSAHASACACGRAGARCKHGCA
jgi:hypothetical protein